MTPWPSPSLRAFAWSLTFSLAARRTLPWLAVCSPSLLRTGSSKKAFFISLRIRYLSLPNKITLRRFTVTGIYRFRDSVSC